MEAFSQIYILVSSDGDCSYTTIGHKVSTGSPDQSLRNSLYNVRYCTRRTQCRVGLSVCCCKSIQRSLNHTALTIRDQHSLDTENRRDSLKGGYLHGYFVCEPSFQRLQWGSGSVSANLVGKWAYTSGQLVILSIFGVFWLRLADAEAEPHCTLGHCQSLIASTNAYPTILAPGLNVR